MLEAAVRVLGQRPDASVEEVATAAGVTRQTVYAHYPSRRALLDAVMRKIADDFVAELADVAAASTSATAGLLRWLDTSWQILERYPLLTHPSVAVTSPEESYDNHRPIIEQLRQLIRKGQSSGEFDRDVSEEWLIAATIALGHAAGEEVAAGRLASEDAGAALRRSVLRLYGASEG